MDDGIGTTTQVRYYPEFNDGRTHGGRWWRTGAGIAGYDTPEQAQAFRTDVNHHRSRVLEETTTVTTRVVG